MHAHQGESHYIVTGWIRPRKSLKLISCHSQPLPRDFLSFNYFLNYHEALTSLSVSIELRLSTTLKTLSSSYLYLSEEVDPGLTKNLRSEDKRKSVKINSSVILLLFTQQIFMKHLYLHKTCTYTHYIYILWVIQIIT